MTDTDSTPTYPRVLVRSEQSSGRIGVIESLMPAGAAGPPLHTHDFDEAFYVLEGEIVLNVDGEDRLLGPGGFAVATRGEPHAFMAISETKLLCWQTPGTAQAFFRHASEPTSDDAIDGPVDFTRVRASAKVHGGVEILGPPPFAPSGSSPRS